LRCLACLAARQPLRHIGLLILHAMRLQVMGTATQRLLRGEASEAGVLGKARAARSTQRRLLPFFLLQYSVMLSICSVLPSASLLRAVARSARCERKLEGEE
jgi:hypothetical protein